jgi:hypothetical protein
LSISSILQDQEVISSIVSKVVKEYMDLKSEPSEKSDGKRERKVPVKTQDQKEKEAVAAINPASKDPPPAHRSQVKKGPVHRLPNLVPSVKKQQKSPPVAKAAPRRKRTRKFDMYWFYQIFHPWFHC